MRIRKYLIMCIAIFILIIVITIFSMKKYYQHQVQNDYSCFQQQDLCITAKVVNEQLQVYSDTWNDFQIKGVRLSSYYPGYERNKSNINKSKVFKWLTMIQEMNANTILIPYIQPTGFYDAIYEYNTTHDQPIYMIHEISHDLKKTATNYDVFDPNYYQDYLDTIKTTVDVVHGHAIITNDKKYHIGMYLKDLSAYNLGYIVGANTTPEIVSITNMKNSDKTSYDGKYYSIANGTSFEVYITELLDKLRIYEENKYHTTSILSYNFNAETDPFNYENESNYSSNANIDLKKISNLDNLFVSLVAQPNAPDFLDVLYSTHEDYYYEYLKSYTDYYDMPVIVSEVGVSSSRGMSKVNISQNYNRGNYDEQSQSDTLIALLTDATRASISGLFVDSFQDDWSRISTPNLKNIIDKSSSSYWYDAQASDESFGLVAFDPTTQNDIIVDGNIDDWDNIDNIIEESRYSLKVNANSAYLYLLIHKENWQLNDDRIFLGIDLNDKIGSNYYQDENVYFSSLVDFIIKFNGVNDTDIVVNGRYDIFTYNYMYYENVLGKLEVVPDKNTAVFNPVYLLNRRTFYDKITGQVLSSIYYNTGDLVYGTTNYTSNEYNSLADFKKTEDYVEVRIPWTLINVKDPFSKTIQGDFYDTGINSAQKITNLNFSLSYQGENGFMSPTGIYKIPTFTEKYLERKKIVYYSLQEYFKGGD